MSAEFSQRLNWAQKLETHPQCPMLLDCLQLMFSERRYSPSEFISISLLPSAKLGTKHSWANIIYTDNKWQLIGCPISASECNRATPLPFWTEGSYYQRTWWCQESIFPTKCHTKIQLFYWHIFKASDKITCVEQWHLYSKYTNFKIMASNVQTD